MVHFRYSRWSGTQRDGLDSDAVFDQLNDYMSDTGDLQQAMRRLMQKGMKGEKQTKGIEDLLSQVAKEMRKLYDEYRLQSALDEIQEQLESIVDQERETLEQLDQQGNDVQEKKQYLNDLPGKSSEAIEKLTSYSFENPDAAKQFQQLVMDLEQIRNLHAGVAVDEMQHPMMGAPETKFQKHLVGVADEVTVGKKQQFDDVPNGLRRRSARRTAFCHPCTGYSDLAHIYVSHIDIFCSYVTKTVPKTKGSYQKDPFRWSMREVLTASFRVGQVIPAVTG